jgi:2'-5' RNA ligase
MSHATARYAIYLAPPADTPLWQFGSRVLGYDAATGADLPGFATAGLDAAAWHVLTERPRTYGFHATLKAPFRLAPGETIGSLSEAARRLAACHPAFDLGPLGVRPIVEGTQGFVALVQQREASPLVALESAVVEGLDRFRAPLTPDEIAARRPDRLTERQRDNFLRWGYHMIGADFRFHMTLSGATAAAPDIADALSEDMAAAVGAAHLFVDALVLFEQPTSGQRFRIIGRFPLAA